jgi:Methyltransferase domain
MVPRAPGRWTIRRLADRARYVGHAAAAVARQPREGVERTVERAAEWRDRRRGASSLDVTERGKEELARLFGPPEESQDGFDPVWHAALGDLRARGLQTGRGVFGGWDDADPCLGRLAWWLTRRLRPEFVVETGVARGLTTRVILEALERNGRGRLWSIDLPPLIEQHLWSETGAAVPPQLRTRWTLLTCSSRRRLPGLVRELPRIDLFVHDSMHTTRNVLFELDQVWPALPPRGAMLVDDVERNHAVGRFLREHLDAAHVICRATDGRALIGVVVKNS